MRVAEATTAAAFAAAWERSDRIFELVTDEALLSRPIALRQPFLFYIGHLPAFAWNKVSRRVLGRASFHPQFDSLFERGIDPPDDQDLPRDDQATAWPPLAEVLAYRDRIRAALQAAFDEPKAAGDLDMVLEHELMHQETLLYMVHELADERKRAPRGLPAFVFEGAAARGQALVPTGAARLGRPRTGEFGWDNEFEETTVEVPAFRIDTTPVRVREFREFVLSGGYENRALWSADGWDWKERRGMAHPHGWRRTAAGWRCRTLLREIDLDDASEWPVYVSRSEAAAFARWRGLRLPTEAELHRAARATPEGGWRRHPWGDADPGPEHGNFGFRNWAPVPVGSFPAGQSAFGVHELVGNGWEWTDTPFAPFPGFRPMAGYPEYSADFFDDRHFVLLGASWATDARLVRPSFRNWFQPHYPYVFAKFRLVAPA
jgi:ergothioneine biosynthesis protein EgtB